MNRLTRRKRRTSVFLGATLLALAFGVSVGVAKSGPSQVKVPFQLADPTTIGGVCGEPALTKKQVGKGNVSAEKGGPIKIVAQFRGVETGKYEVFLLDGDCTITIDVGSFSVGNDGSTGCKTSFPGLPAASCGEGTLKVTADPATFPFVPQTFSILLFNTDTAATFIKSTLFKLRT